ncbi:hypothetical protein ACO3VM_05800 [Methanocaldococcus sp. 10A]
MTDGTFLQLIYINPANQHDLYILKENYPNFIREFEGCSIIGDKGYIDKGFQNLLSLGKVYFESIKRINMIKSFPENLYYNILKKLRKSIETNFSRFVEKFPKHIRAVSKKGLSVKLILFTIASNFEILDMVKSH